MQNRQMQLIGALIVVLVVIAGAWYLSRGAAPANPGNSGQATSTPATASSTSPAGSQASSQPSSSQPSTSQPSAPVSLPVSSQDTVASWSFTGAYSGNADLTQKAQVDIARLSGSVNEQDPTVQETYISIGKDYMLLGDGKNAYTYFLKALNSSQQDGQESAVAWANLGQLMSMLGANHTALTAYQSATVADPTEPSFYVSLINFLMEKMPGDSVDITAAFAAADKNVPGDMSIDTLQGQYDQMHH